MAVKIAAPSALAAISKLGLKNGLFDKLCNTKGLTYALEQHPPDGDWNFTISGLGVTVTTESFTEAELHQLQFGTLPKDKLIKLRQNFSSALDEVLSIAIEGAADEEKLEGFPFASAMHFLEKVINKGSEYDAWLAKYLKHGVTFSLDADIAHHSYAIVMSLHGVSAISSYWHYAVYDQIMQGKATGEVLAPVIMSIVMMFEEFDKKVKAASPPPTPWMPMEITELASTQITDAVPTFPADVMQVVASKSKSKSVLDKLPFKKMTPAQAAKTNTATAVHIAETSNIDETWGTYPIANAKTADRVPLRDATRLYTPVIGTSQDSRYYLVAATDDLRVAARYKQTQLSVRIEGPKFEKFASVLVQAGLSVNNSGTTPYASVHLNVGHDLILASKTLGAILMCLGVHFKTHYPSVEQLKKLG